MSIMRRLTAEERARCIEIGTWRHYTVPEDKRGSSKPIGHQRGYCTEFAFSSESGLPMDENIYFNDVDLGYDFGGIEIKSATWGGDDIEFKMTLKEYSKKIGGITAIVLCRIDPDMWWVEIIGWLSREEFMERKYEKKHLRHNWTVNASQMHPITKDNIHDFATMYYDGAKAAG